MKYLLLFLPILCNGQRITYGFSPSVILKSNQSSGIEMRDSGYRKIAYKDSVWHVIDTAATLQKALEQIEEGFKRAEDFNRKEDRFENFRLYLQSLPCGPFLIEQYRKRDRHEQYPQTPDFFNQ